MSWQGFKTFIVGAFSENGVPSSSRILSTWLSISSMALLWFIVRHAMSQPTEKLQVWVGGIPAIIMALATFAVSPYTVAKLGQAISSFSDKST